MSIDATSSIAQIAMTCAFFFSIALFILLALIKIEDVFNYADQRRRPIKNLLKGEDDFRERVSRLVNLYQVLAKFAVIGLLISSLIVIGVYPASSLFQFPPSLESPLIAMPSEAIFLMFFVLVLLLLVLLMKIEAVWVYTTIETKGWDHHSDDASALEERVERRMDVAMNAIAACVLLVPMTLLALVLRLAGVWD